MTRKRPRVSDDEDGEVFIPKLSALSPGKIPYSPSRIHGNTLLFLRELKGNNERDWFQQREKQYLAAKDDFESFILEVVKIIQRHDGTIPTLPCKDLVFRIYRDVRFSNDRTPYKTNLSAAISRAGRKGIWACYYLSIQPGASLLGCGLWHPEASSLAKIREHIDSDSDAWHAIIDDPGFTGFFKDGLSRSDVLKTCPKGYSKDHSEIELLKLKSFTTSISFTDDEVTSAEFVQILDLVIAQMVPFVTMLNEIIDPDDESD